MVIAVVPIEAETDKITEGLLDSAVSAAVRPANASLVR